MSDILSNVHKLLTPYNYNAGNVSRIKYIVIHYVGGTGSAEQNCKYYAQSKRNASAHYYVDFDGSVWQSVEDKNIAWHCGAKKYVHPECRNKNSIGIELCVRNKGNKSATSRDWYFEDATVKAAIELTKALMKKYNVPAGHVIRHYDVTGKICPNPFVYNQGKYSWNDFKNAISATTEPAVKSGWIKEPDGWHFYFNNGVDIKNDWYKDATGKWAWFNGSGVAISNNWYQYENAWYYFGADCYMYESKWLLYKNQYYYFDADGKMVTSAYIRSKDPTSELYYWIDENGIYQSKWNTKSPDLNNYRLVE